MANITTEDFDNALSFEDYSKFGADLVPATLSEVWSAGLKFYDRDTIGGTNEQIDRLNEIKQQGGYSLSANELNNKYKDEIKSYGLQPFNASMNEEAANFIIQTAREGAELNQIIESGQDRDWYGVTRFGAGLAAFMMDPKEVAIGVGSGIASAGIAGLMGVAAPLGVVAVSAAGDFLAETGVRTYVRSRREEELQEAFTMQQVLFEATFGAALGAGIGVGAVAIKGVKPHVVKLFGEGTEGIRRRFVKERSAAAQVSSGKKVDVTPMDEMEAKGKTDVGQEKEMFESLDVTNINPERRLYVPVKGMQKRLKGVTSKMIPLIDDESLGDVVAMTDNKTRANNTSLSDYEKSGGGMIEVTLKKDAKLIDLDAPLEVEIPSIKEAGIDTAGKSGNQVMKELKDYAVANDLGDDFINKVNAEFKEAGFHGYKRVVKDNIGSDHNVVKVFDRAVLRQRKHVPSKAEFKPKPTPEEKAKIKKDMDAPERDIDYDPDAQKQIDEAEASVDQKPDVDAEDVATKVEAETVQQKEAVTAFQASDEFKRLPKELQDQAAKRIKEAEDQLAQIDQESRLAKEFDACVNGGLGGE